MLRPDPEQLAQIIINQIRILAEEGELVRALARHFAEARTASKPTNRQQQANAWLPSVMHFPAIDPDATDDKNGETLPAAA